MSSKQVTVTAINAFNDNYIWALSNETSDNANNLVLVDPGDAIACIEHIEKHQHVLSAILITHHHHDHVGGIAKLLHYASEKNWSVKVYGPANEKIDHLDITLIENDQVSLPEINGQFSVLDLPGHTKGHIAYVNPEMVFCGDTLFSGGCGRLFEGTPAQMLQSLTKLSNLPEKTFVYCAHEYTQANLSFALAVEPENTQLQEYATKVNDLRANGLSSIPTNIGLEQQINPFLRCNQASVKLSAQTHAKQILNDPTAVFATIRSWKDNF